MSTPVRLPILLGLAVAFGGCAGTKMFTQNAVPEPGASFPYGLVALDLETGDTRRPKILMKRTGYIDRYTKVRGDGVVVMRLNPGEWTMQITGNPGEGDVIKFAGRGKAQAKPPAKGPAWWPKKPIEVRVARNRLTWVGRVCAHRTCPTDWSATTNPAVDRWQTVRRLIRLNPPPASTPEKPKEKAVKGADKEAAKDTPR